MKLELGPKELFFSVLPGMSWQSYFLWVLGASSTRGKFQISAQATKMRPTAGYEHIFTLWQYGPWREVPWWRPQLPAITEFIGCFLHSMILIFFGLTVFTVLTIYGACKKCVDRFHSDRGCSHSFRLKGSCHWQMLLVGVQCTWASHLFC